MCIFLLQSVSKCCMLKFGIWLVYVSINTVWAVFISSKPLSVRPYSSFKPKPIKTSSFITLQQGYFGFRKLKGSYFICYTRVGLAKLYIRYRGCQVC